MANQEHLDILKQGVETWNQWRKQHIDIRPDLSNAHLKGAHLAGANLREARLNGANLSHAKLSDTSLLDAEIRAGAIYSEDYLKGRAMFREDDLEEDHLWFGVNIEGGSRPWVGSLEKADLEGADLSYAKLRMVILSHANLEGAHLAGANLKEARLNGANLSHANLRGADFRRAHLENSNFWNADLSGADLNGALLKGASLESASLISVDLGSANLSHAKLGRANLHGANLSYTELEGANLEGANLEEAVLIRTNLRGAVLTGCSIYGISAWNVHLEGSKQDSLIITPWNEPIITVDNLKIAQFLYLLLNNAEIRDTIDTIARKAVLILGRFTPERKAVLDALREALRTHDYVPILFDFDRPSSRNVTETVKTLAHLSRFIIADLTDPSSIPYELAQIVPGLAVPVQPVLLEGRRAFAMFPDLPRTYHWVLPTYSYTDQAHLLATLQEHVIAPAEQKAQELEKR